MPSLLTISIYNVHHVIARFIRLYRQVQVISDCLTFACSLLCCQCWAMLPENPRDVEDKPSHEGFIILPQHVIDERKACGDRLKQNLIDFSPQKEDTEEVQKKCVAFWRRENHETVKDNNDSAQLHHEDPNATVTNTVVTSRGDELPAVHAKATNKSK
ncbi:uncharacterized protein LOC106136346 [Amyelois transitella]|uniref:uncharacterized protein LOC106136346 n=1 Tax=Amyelois transitella TaxID=680683 RepID=UPI00298F9548|nr:uncharacterized protein LOC106136346 [Amyelois transitella]